MLKLRLNTYHGGGQLPYDGTQCLCMITPNIFSLTQWCCWSLLADEALSAVDIPDSLLNVLWSNKKATLCKDSLFVTLKLALHVVHGLHHLDAMRGRTNASSDFRVECCTLMMDVTTGDAGDKERERKDKLAMKERDEEEHSDKACKSDVANVPWLGSDSGRSGGKGSGCDVGMSSVRLEVMHYQRILLVDVKEVSGRDCAPVPGKSGLEGRS